MEPPPELLESTGGAGTGGVTSCRSQDPERQQLAVQWLEQVVFPNLAGMLARYRRQGA